MTDYFKNKVAVVTGGSSGIGLGICEQLLRSKAKNVILVGSTEEKLQREAARLNQTYPGKVFGIRADVTREEDVLAMIEQAAKIGGGKIDLLINNAGAGLGGSFNDATNADWAKAFDLNFYGALYGMRAAIPLMKANGGGQIANTASGIAFSPMAYQSMYSATKSALVGLTLALRTEYWDDSIRLSVIIPGTVATPIWGEGGAPPEAITPEQSAVAILKGLEANDRVIITTEQDLGGAINAFNPAAAKGTDEYLLNVARSRRAGKWIV